MHGIRLQYALTASISDKIRLKGLACTPSLFASAIQNALVSTAMLVLSTTTFRPGVRAKGLQCVV
jgi:hypothetical protein